MNLPEMQEHLKTKTDLITSALRPHIDNPDTLSLFIDVMEYIEQRTPIHIKITRLTGFVFALKTQAEKTKEDIPWFHSQNILTQETPMEIGQRVDDIQAALKKINLAEMLEEASSVLDTQKIINNTQRTCDEMFA